MPLPSSLFLENDLPKRCFGGGGDAFTLVEVMLALGILVFVTMAILGVVTSFLGNSRESWEETRAAHIARQIVDDLGSGTNQDGYLVLGTNYDSPTVRTNIDLTHTNSAGVTAYYDIDGLPLGQAGSGAPFRAEIRIYPETDTNAVPANPLMTAKAFLNEAQVEVRVTPSGTDTNPFLFLTRIAIPSLSSP